jgi:glycosyltransferase involved in cell wall biosynthesis
MTSFLDAAAALLARMPDAVPRNAIDLVRAKSRVMPVPLVLPDRPARTSTNDPPIVLWNHRWEHDKDPGSFFDALDELDRRGVAFRLIVCGQRYRQAPDAFEAARTRFAARIEHFGGADRAAYEALLARADIVVSTARHEFFGIAALEATHFGAYPLVPDDLAYPEIFPEAHRYPRGALADALEAVLARRDLVSDRSSITAPFGRPLLDAYERALEAACHGDGGPGSSGPCVPSSETG